MGYQTCRYRKNDNGEIEAEMFDSDDVPDGWVDSPADLKNGSDPVMPNPPEHTLGLTDVSEPKAIKKTRKKRGN